MTRSLLVTLYLQGQLASWGASEFGQLGQSTEVQSQPVPRIVKGLKDVRLARCGEVWEGVCSGWGIC